MISRGETFDMQFTPRMFETTDRNGYGKSCGTYRERRLRERLQLPVLHQSPVPPHCPPDEPQESRAEKLLGFFQEFAMELHSGVHLNQLTSNNDYCDIHCQLMDDLQTLKLDQSNGHIIEFPLTGVSKIYRIIKSTDGGWYNATSSAGLTGGVEHIVVVEFMRRKLAFVFEELEIAQRFLMCMELLIRRAQQKQVTASPRALTPAIPSPINKTK